MVEEIERGAFDIKPFDGAVNSADDLPNPEHITEPEVRAIRRGDLAPDVVVPADWTGEGYERWISLVDGQELFDLYSLKEYTIEDEDGGNITATETSLSWTDALGNNNEDRVYREIANVKPFTTSFDVVINEFVDSDDSTFDAFISGFTTDNELIDGDFIGMVIGGDETESLAVYVVSVDDYTGDVLYGEADAQVGSTFGTGDTQSIDIGYDFDNGELEVTVNGSSEIAQFDETKDWSCHQVIATMSDQGFSQPGDNTGELTNYNASPLS